MTKEQHEQEIQNTIKDIAALGFKKLSLSPEDAAAIIDVDISTLYNWRRDGIGPQYSKGEGKRGKVIYTPRSIAEYLLNRVQTA